MSGDRSTGAVAAATWARWASWLVGLATLAVVIFVGRHFAEEQEFVRLAEQARPQWLAVAVLLQGCTYLAQAQTWRGVLRRAAAPIPVTAAYELSLAQLFIDQALPSIGISGTIVVARALVSRGIPRGAVMAAVVVGTISFHVSYVLALAAALLITILGGHADALVIAAAVAFILFSAVLTAAVVAIPGRPNAKPAWVRRVPLLRRTVALLAEADTHLSRSRALIVESSGYQLLIVVLDASTMWFLVLALGEVASPSGVFASFMLASLLRTIGVVPGGLGTFEAVSVLTLRLVGVPVGAALAATLLFRGLSFWLPMLPGFVFARAARRMASPPRAAGSEGRQPG